MLRPGRSILFGPLPPPYGGVSVFMNAICAPVIERGVHVWSYLARGGYPDSAENPRYVNHRRFAHIWALFREGRHAQITDSTHFHLEYPNILLLPMWIFAKSVLRFRWIKLLHDGSLPSRYENFGPVKKWLFRAAIYNIDEFIVYSRDLESWLKQVIKFERKIAFMPLLLPLPADWGIKSVDAELTEKLERFSAHQKRVSSIGVFIPSYGFHHVAAEIEKIRRETNEDIGLLLVDAQFAENDGYRESVVKGRDWIEIATKVPHPCLNHVFSKSHVFVRAFEHESFGLSRVEALWCGTPVIATNIGETRGMLLYDCGDMDQLRHHLKEVLAGRFEIDIARWADIFQMEAQENLKNYVRAITGDTSEAYAD